MSHRPVTITETAPRPYAQAITTGPHILSADEPASMGGNETGPTPFELLCAALGACTNMTLRMYAAQKGWPLEQVQTTVVHEKATAEDNLKRDVFHRSISLSGPLDDDQRQRLLEIAERCPVSRTLQAQAEMSYELI